MIAYFAPLTTALFLTISHKLAYHHYDECVLFIHEPVYRSKKLLYVAEELKKEKIFTDVVTSCLMCPKSLIPPNANEDILEKIILDYYNKLFKRVNYDISKFDKIYALNDNHGAEVNIYFNMINIRYTWVETEKNRTPDGSPTLNAGFLPLYKKYNPTNPFAKCADACIIDESDQTKLKLKGKDYTTWNPKECKYKFTQEDWQHLFNCYHLNEFELSVDSLVNSTVVVENSYGLLTESIVGMSWKENLRSKYLGFDYHFDNNIRAEAFSTMDRLSIDFYAPETENIYVKYHINDMNDQETTTRLYGDNATVLPNVLFQIIAQYFESKNIRFNNIIATASTALSSDFESAFDNVYLLGFDFSTTWWMYISIYTALLFAKSREMKKIYTNRNIRSQITLLAKKIGYEIEAAELNPSEISVIKESMIIINMCSDIKVDIEKTDQSTVVAFLNDTLCDEFIDSANPEMFVPLIVKKDMISETATDILYFKERVWIYSKDIKTRKAARKFKYERELKNLGMRIHIDGIMLSDAIDEYRQAYDKHYARKMKTHIDDLERELEHTKAFIRNNCDIKTLLCKTNDIEQYLDIISLLPQKYALFMAVSDTPGNKMTDSVLSKLKKLGFTRLERTLWKMYIGVIAGGNVIYDTVAENANVPIEYKFFDIHNGDSFDIKSEPWKNGNQAVISVNGKDYSVNIRGINIVVYDVEKKEVVDSIGYDSHGTANGVFRRKDFLQ